MSSRHGNACVAVPQERLRALPAKAAHFRVWLPGKKLALTQSTCSNDIFGQCGAVMHQRARGRAMLSKHCIPF